MKKIAAIGLILFIIIGFSGFVAAKETQNEGKPFKELFEAIGNLKTTMKGEEKERIAADKDLQEQVDTVNSTITSLQGQVDALESTGIKGFYIKTEPNCREFPYGGWCHSYAEATCNSGDKVTGGGFSFTVLRPSEDDVWTVSKNMPNSEGNGWYVKFTSEHGSVDPEEDIEFTTYAICADMT